MQVFRPGRSEVFLYTSATDAAETKTGLSTDGRVSLPDPFLLEAGDSLLGAEVRYSLGGPKDAPLVVALGGISATREVTNLGPEGALGWWSEMVGPGRAVDTNRFRVLGIDWLGKHATDFLHLEGSTPPAWPEPGGARSYPVITTGDQARALFHVLAETGLDRVHTFIGSSYGGMVGLAFAVEFPAVLDRLVVISGAHRTHPMATAHRLVQRRIVELGRAGGFPDHGLALSRALAMTTYRSIEEFEERFNPSPLTEPAVYGFEVESYLLAQGEKFCARTTADAFLCLSLSIDIHDVPPSSVVVPTDLISVRSDSLVPTWLMDELEKGLAGPSSHERIDSLYGHDAFLKEVETIGGRLRQILDRDRRAI